MHERISVLWAMVIEWRNFEQLIAKQKETRNKICLLDSFS